MLPKSPLQDCHASLVLKHQFQAQHPHEPQVSPIHSHETQISSRHVQPPRMPCPHPLRLGHLRCRLGNGGPPPGRFWRGAFIGCFGCFFFLFCLWWFNRTFHSWGLWLFMAFLCLFFYWRRMGFHRVFVGLLWACKRLKFRDLRNP